MRQQPGIYRRGVTWGGDTSVYQGLSMIFSDSTTLKFADGRHRTLAPYLSRRVSKTSSSQAGPMTSTPVKSSSMGSIPDCGLNEERMIDAASLPAGREMSSVPDFSIFMIMSTAM